MTVTLTGHKRAKNPLNFDQIGLLSEQSGSEKESGRPLQRIVQHLWFRLEDSGFK